MLQNSFSQSKIPIIFTFLFPLTFPFFFELFYEESIEMVFTITLMADLIISILIALIFNRSYCGFMCPVGAAQRISTSISSKIFKKEFNIPANLDKLLKGIKYLLLIGLIIMSIRVGKILIVTGFSIDQFKVYFPNIPSIVTIVSVLFVLVSLLYSRTYCRYLCVKGALFGITGRISPSRIVRKSKLCTNCQLCTRACPVKLEVHNVTKMTSMECLFCRSCIQACPNKGALTSTFATQKISFPKLVAAVLIFYTFGILILVHIFK